jgi:hypothetical protein
MDDDIFKPVPHDSAFREKILSDPEVKAIFDKTAEKYAEIDAKLRFKKERCPQAAFLLNRKVQV